MDHESTELAGRVKRARELVLYQDEDGVEVAQWRIDVAVIGDEDFEKAEGSLEGCRVLYDKVLTPPSSVRPEVAARVLLTLEKENDVWSPEAEWVVRKG